MTKNTLDIMDIYGIEPPDTEAEREAQKEREIRGELESERMRDWEIDHGCF